MKTTKLLLAAAVFTGLASISFAGPGAQFWAQQGKSQTEQKAKADAPAKSAKESMACGSGTCCQVKK